MHLLIALLVACSVPTTEDRLRAAEEAMDRLEHRAALDELTLVMSAADATDDQLVRAHLLAGVVQRLAGNDTEARMHFLVALRRRPDVALPARDESKSPRVSAFFAEVRNELMGGPPPPLSPTSSVPPVAAPADEPGDAPVVDAPAVERFPWLLVAGGITAGASALVAGAAFGGTYYANTVVGSPLRSTTERQDAQKLGRVLLLGTGIALLGVIAGTGLMATALVVGE